MRSLGGGGGVGCQYISPIGQFRFENLTVRHCCDHVALLYDYDPKLAPNRNSDAGQTPNNKPSLMDPAVQIEQRTPATQLTNPSYPLRKPLRTRLSYTAHTLSPTRSRGVWVLQRTVQSRSGPNDRGIDCGQLFSPSAQHTNSP